MVPLWSFLAAIAYTIIGIYLLKNIDKISMAFLASDSAFKKALNFKDTYDKKKSLLGIKILVFIVGGSFAIVGILAFFIFVGSLLSKLAKTEF